MTEVNVELNNKTNAVLKAAIDQSGSDADASLCLRLLIQAAILVIAKVRIAGGNDPLPGALEALKIGVPGIIEQMGGNWNPAWDKPQ